MIKLFKFYYWLLFFGIGCLYPLLAIYFEDIGLSGSQIGILLAVGPMITIVAQPIWGVISDKFQKPTYSLIIASLMSSVIVLCFLLDLTFTGYVFLVIILASFHTPLVPIMDSITLNYVKEEGCDYGGIRLWGALGFAMAVWITGIIIELTFTGIIFYIFTIALILGAWSASKLPNKAVAFKINIPLAMKKLFAIPPYVLLLCSTFLIFGSMNANNFYFGLYYMSIGGTFAGVGLVFLFAAGSEAPIMKMANYYISKYGLVNILIFSSIVSAIRWSIFYMEPSMVVIIAISLLQGISIGLYIPASVLLVRELSPSDIQATSMSVFSSVGNGLGSTFCIVVAGLLLDSYSPSTLYLFFAVATVIGIIILLTIRNHFPKY